MSFSTGLEDLLILKRIDEVPISHHCDHTSTLGCNITFEKYFDAG